MNIALTATKSFNAFARFTAKHTLVSMTLPPSAQYLFQWLLQQKPAGCIQEVDLFEFQAFTGEGRDQPYSTKTIRSALNILIEVGLVEPIRQYNARFWKVIAYHPGQKEPSQVETKLSQLEKEISQKQPSNSYPTVPSYREYRETTDTVPTLHPVQEVELQGDNFEAVATSLGQAKEEEGLLEQSGETEITEQEKSEEKKNTLVFSDEGKIDPQLKKQIEEAIAPAPMNPQIKKAVLAASLEAVEDAIAVVKQRKEAGRVKNPAGLFVKAVKEQWKPSGNKTVHDTLARIPEDFNEWFDLARKKGLVIASSVMDGVLCVCTRNQKWEPYEEFRSGFSLPWLKRSLAIT